MDGMAYATNAMDDVRIYYRELSHAGSPVVALAGLGDTTDWLAADPFVQRLATAFRVVALDHRGHGHSDAPHDVNAYALPRRVADVVAVVDALGVERVHVLGFSWGARLGFACGEHAPDRLLSLVLTGNQPYAWDRSWPFVTTLTAAFETARTEGMQGCVDALESSFGSELDALMRESLLASDPLALSAAWSSALAEGPLSADLGAWSVPCLIVMADSDPMYANARRAAGEIPRAQFMTLPGHTHLSGGSALMEVAERVLNFLR